MVNIIKLDFAKTLKHRLNSNNQLIQVVLGPRQVGKTTTVLKMANEDFKDKIYYVSADKVFNTSSNWLSEQWYLAKSKAKILIVDEIQKIENWSETIKVLYDESKREGTNVKCVLLGSSSLQIQRGLTESLTGRFQLIKTYHWNYQESKKAYGITFDQFLKYGGYPGSYQFISEQKEWFNYVKNSIVRTVVEKDILQFQNVKKPTLFKQAFDLIMSYPAQEISYTKLLGQLQDKGNVEIVKYYLKLYEGAFLIKVLDKFSSKAIKVKSSSPKILPLAPCLPFLNIRTDYNQKELGRVFELLVGSQLVRTGEDIYYWREGNKEVDFVLQVGRIIYAIEVKSGSKKQLKGLSGFKEMFPDARLVIIDQENYQEFEQHPLRYIEDNYS